MVCPITQGDHNQFSDYPVMRGRKNKAHGEQLATVLGRLMTSFAATDPHGFVCSSSFMQNTSTVNGSLLETCPTPATHNHERYRPTADSLQQGTQGILCGIFSNKVINRWNELDQSAVDAPSVSAFKKSLEKVRNNRMGFFMDQSTELWANCWSMIGYSEAAHGKLHGKLRIQWLKWYALTGGLFQARTEGPKTED